MNVNQPKPRRLARWFALSALACLGWAASAAANEVDAKIKHRPVESAPSGVRIEFAARIQDAGSVDVARVYFKAEREANFLFVPMRGSGESYAATLPAPSAGVGAIEYRILVRNLDEVVYKTQAYAVEIEDGDAAVAADSERIEVFTELAEAPDTVHGFTDNIALGVAESAAKYGVVAGLTSEANAGTAASTVGATGGTTVAASAGPGTAATVGIATAAVAATGGVVVATQDDDENRAPEFADDSTLALSVPEGTAGTIGSPVTATDSDGDALAYSLSGADAGFFRIDASGGQLSVPASTELDFEARTNYTFQVVASDGDLTATRSVSLAVSDVNEAPAFPAGDLALNVPENAVGAIGESVAATDPDGDELTYSLSGTDAGLFEIGETSGQLSVPASTNLDFETEPNIYAFEIVSTDPNGLEDRRTLLVTVTNENEPPEFENSNELKLFVKEGHKGAIGEPVVATDPDDGDTRTYSLGGTDADLFEIDEISGQLSVPESTDLDFETEPNAYALEVVATDSSGLDAQRKVLVTVTDDSDEESSLENDWRILVSLYNATGGADWVNNDNWSPSLETVPTAEELDSWHGVAVSNERVVSILLVLNNLNGSIPPELGGLASLELLFLGSNRLSGPIPPELGNLASLEQLYLRYNQLSGPIPPELGDLASLEKLVLHDNQLSGPIPPELGDLASLALLYLHDNQLSGPIPPELGDLASLALLYLHENQLSGPIPPELGDLASLESLVLRENQLSGPIPSELGDLASLTSLVLHDNQLSGPIPPELGDLASLERLLLHDNQLVDELPSALTNLDQLLYFYWHDQDVADAETSLCAPDDDEFQTWLEDIGNKLEGIENISDGPTCSKAATSGASAAAPRVEGMAIVSDPGPDGVYAAGETVEAAVRFDRPVTVSGAPRLRLGIGGKAALADLAPPRGEAGVLLFRYAVASGDRDLDGVSIAADALQLNGGAVAGPDGAAALGLGEHAVEDDAGHVVDTRARAAERAVLEDALAAQGRAHLASAVEVIGARFRAGPAAPLGLAGGSGRAEGPRPAGRDAGAFAGARGFDAQGGPSMAPGGACDRRPFGVRQAGPACGRADGASLGSLFGRRFAVSLGARGEGSPASGWTLWGANDARAFRGDAAHGSYDGGLRSFYLGVDGRLGEDWLAGVALARSRGETGYGFEVDGFAGDGMLRTRLNAVHPYLRGRLASGLEVWGVAGLGFGAASLERDGAARTEASGLGLGLGAFGVRQGLADFGALSLSLLADAGFARLWTGDGPPDGVAGGLSASVGRLRVGVEGEHALALPGGGSLRPFWQASGRYDGGDGLPGGGLELAGGARYRSERLEGEVRARWLAAHSASSIEEFGASANLRVRAGADGLGLAASLAPRWGAADFGGVEAMWREDALRAARAGGASRRRPDREPWALEGRLEYGVALPRAAGVLTPFGELRLAGESTLRQRWGVRLDRAVGERSLLGVEFGAARVDRPLGGSAGAASVAVEARF